MLRSLIFILFILCILTKSTTAQEINAAYVKSLYKKYPTQKSAFCAGCKLWVNPYYKSIADTTKHAPLLTFYVYTKAHRLEQEALDLPRKGIYASWHAVNGQPAETKLYHYANENSIDMIAKGHCQAWILMAWCADAAILSDTYTFNAGMEYQGQNIGTELATEEFCRKLTGYRGEAVTDSVKIWCGTFGAKQSYTLNAVTATVPAYYYKIIQYRDHNVRGDIILCYLMPNEPGEKRNMLSKRIVSYNDLVARLGFDPKLIFN
ncbi:MAG: non-specific endonuclease [Mucilaginibacter sp.]|nr:non-specific endonuclease [Mucilaginibacter sp.]